MKNVFSTEGLHRITEANINYYARPFVHPRRRMQDHDFIYLLEGEWKLGQNDEVFDLGRDSLLILAADQTHYGAAPCAPGTKTMYFHVSGEAIKAAGSSVSVDSIHHACSQRIKRLFSDVVHCKLSGEQRKAELYFALLLCELEENATSSADTAVAVKIRDLIHANPERFLGNAELAEAVNVSVKTAETKFKAQFGVTIHQYALDFKIKEAISYFEVFPDVSVKEIASNLGFYDEYHFSKQFKKLVGVSPSHYKKEAPRKAGE